MEDSNLIVDQQMPKFKNSNHDFSNQLNSPNSNFQTEEKFYSQKNRNVSSPNELDAKSTEISGKSQKTSQLEQGKEDFNQHHVMAPTQTMQKINHYRQIATTLDTNDQILEYFKNTHKPHNNEVITLSELHESQHLKIKKYKQSIFYGEIINDKRMGKGIMLYFNGRIYEGEWQNDFKFGRGYEIYPNGNKYEGYFINGKPEGMGTYIWQNGEIYDGQWLGGLKHGLGMWKGTKGDSYTGEWKFGKADGYGVHIWLNGDRYEGQFKSCLKHGEGTEKFANGDYYTGQYINGRPEGFGEYFWKNGILYKGQFKNGLRHGQGVWKKGTQQNADKYEGEYKNDKKSGYGIFLWTSGNIYKGEYCDDFRHGYGEMQWVDGSYYKGQWERGIQSGEGELFIPNEGTRKGMFVNNVFVDDIEQLQPDDIPSDLRYQTEQSDKYKINQQINLHHNESFKMFKKKMNIDKENYNQGSYQECQLSQMSRSGGGFKRRPVLNQTQNYPINQSVPIPIRTYTKSRNRISTQTSVEDHDNGKRSNRINSIQSVDNKTKVLKRNTLYNPNFSSPDQRTTYLQVQKFPQVINQQNENYQRTNKKSKISKISYRGKYTPASTFSLDNKQIQHNLMKQYEARTDMNDSQFERSISQNDNMENLDKIITFFLQQKNLIHHMNHRQFSESKGTQTCTNKKNSPKLFTPSVKSRNNFEFPKLNNSPTRRQNNQSSQNYLMQPQNQTYINGSNLLTKHELILWQKTKESKKYSQNYLKNLRDPKVVLEIRKIINPPVWKPAGILKNYSPNKQSSISHSLSKQYLDF